MRLITEVRLNTEGDLIVKFYGTWLGRIKSCKSNFVIERRKIKWVYLGNVFAQQLKLAIRGKWVLIFGLKHIQPVFLNFWTCTNNISKHKICNFFSNFISKACPYVVFLRFFCLFGTRTFYANKCRASPWVWASFYMWGTPYQWSQVAKKRGSPRFRPLKLGGRDIFTTYSMNFFKKASSSSNFWAIFLAFSDAHTA